MRLKWILERISRGPFDSVVARSALYVRRVVKIRCTVRPYDVRIIIDFPLRHVRDGHILLNSETLKTRFQKNCSKRVKVGLGLVDSSDPGSILDQLFAPF